MENLKKDLEIIEVREKSLGWNGTVPLNEGFEGAGCSFEDDCGQHNCTGCLYNLYNLLVNQDFNDEEEVDLMKEMVTFENKMYTTKGYIQLRRLINLIEDDELKEIPVTCSGYLLKSIRSIKNEEGSVDVREETVAFLENFCALSEHCDNCKLYDILDEWVSLETDVAKEAMIERLEDNYGKEAKEL